MSTTSVAANPLNPESPDFIEIRATVFRTVQAAGAVSFPALQYRVSEVGEPNRRRDPRSIWPALKLRGSSVLGQKEIRPWEPVRGIFLSPRLQDLQSERLLEQKQAQIAAFKKQIPNDNTLLLAQEIQRSIADATELPKTVSTSSCELADGFALENTDVVLDVSAIAGAPVLALVTNDLEWLYPDDVRIWRHFERCSNAKAYAAFIARKISIATFPVFKALSAIGVQLHHFYVRDEAAVTASLLAEALHWPPVAKTSTLATHKALAVLRAQFKLKGRSFLLQISRNRLEAALRIGLGKPNAPTNTLLDWQRQAEIDFPAKWRAEIERWGAWESKDLLRHPCRNSEALPKEVQ